MRGLTLYNFLGTNPLRPHAHRIESYSGDGEAHAISCTCGERFRGGPAEAIWAHDRHAVRRGEPAVRWDARTQAARNIATTTAEGTT